MTNPLAVPSPGIALARVSAAILLLIHGVARAGLGTVGDFGGFLTSRGFPAGEAIAWAITIVEIAGGLALAGGLFVVPLCAWFAMQLVAGIVLVHAKDGWFVVGAGRNGVEYSVLLILVLAAVALDTWRASRALDG